MKNFILFIFLVVCTTAFGAGSLSYLKSQQFVTKHITTPSNPASGHNKLYSKSDNKLYFLTSAGAEANLLTSPVGLAGSDVSGTLPTTKGGTGITSYNTGDILYSSASNVLSVLAAGTNGYVLTLSGGVPTWAAAAGGGVSSIGTINSQTKSANGAVISGSTLVMQEADATNNGLVSTGAQTLAGVKTFSSAPNLSSLTASLPLKLDGSKNVTSAAIDLTTAEVTGALVATKGGTGQSTYTTGDTLYASALNTLSKLAAGANGKVLTMVGGVPTWQDAGVLATTICYFKDLKSNGVDGGTFTSGAWQTRVLNTVNQDGSDTSSTCPFATLSSNQVTLNSGQYEFFGTAPSLSVDNSRLRIRNVTDSTTLATGSNQRAGSSANTGALNTVQGLVSLSSSKTIELQHRCDTSKASNGFGSSASTGDNEVYAILSIKRLNEPAQSLRTYCALASSAGVISLETEPWITGSCTFASGYDTCELDFSFTQKPVCVANQLSSTSGQTTYRDDLSDTNTVVIQTFDASGTTTARAHSFCCTGPR